MSHSVHFLLARTRFCSGPTLTFHQSEKSNCDQPRALRILARASTQRVWISFRTLGRPRPAFGWDARRSFRLLLLWVLRVTALCLIATTSVHFATKAQEPNCRDDDGDVDSAAEIVGGEAVLFASCLHLTTYRCLGFFLVVLRLKFLFTVRCVHMCTIGFLMLQGMV